MVRTPQPARTGGKWNYTAELHGEHVLGYSHVDSVPGDPYCVVLRQQTGCGIAYAEWTVCEVNTGAEIHVALYNLPGDTYLPVVVLPFVPGTTTYFDLREVQQCVASHGGRWTTFSTDSVQCSNGGRAIYTSDAEHGDRYEPQNIGPWMVPPGNTPPHGAHMDNSSLSILPEHPTSGGSVHALFQWVSGSCGRYRHTVEVMHRSPTADVTEILIGIGLEGENCADVARIRHAVDLPLLPPGKYRIRIGPPPAGTRSVMNIGGWREFEVQP